MSGVMAPAADFSGTNLVGAECQEADFSGADFRFSNLVGAVLEGALFKGANVSHADFSEAKLGGCSFIGASGEGAQFTGQLHLKLVLAAGSFFKKGAAKTDPLLDKREAARQSRIAQPDEAKSDRDRSVAGRWPDAPKDDGPDKPG